MDLGEFIESTTTEWSEKGPSPGWWIKRKDNEDHETSIFIKAEQVSNKFEAQEMAYGIWKANVEPNL